MTNAAAANREGMSDRTDREHSAEEADVDTHSQRCRRGGSGRSGESPGGRRRECESDGGCRRRQTSDGDEMVGPSAASPPYAEGDGSVPRRGPQPDASSPGPVPRRGTGRLDDGHGGGDDDTDDIHGVSEEGPFSAEGTRGGAELETEVVEAHYVFLVHGWLGIDRELCYLEEALTRQHIERSRRRLPSGPNTSRGVSSIDSVDRNSTDEGDYGAVEDDDGEVVDVVVHTTTCNHGRTSDGIARGGTRLAMEVTDFIKADVRRRLQVRRRPISPRKGDDDDVHVTISFIGYSLGGMYSRYAVSVLPARLQVHVPIATGEEEDGGGIRTVSAAIRLHPRVFCTAATPHLGIASNTYVLLPRTAERLLGLTMGRTGRDLFRINATRRRKCLREGRRRWSNCTCRGGVEDVETTPPESAAATAATAPAATTAGTAQDDHSPSAHDGGDLVYDMATSPKFLRPLSLFQRRIAYANAFATDFQVPVATAAFLSGESRYPQRLVRDHRSSQSNGDDRGDGLIASVFRTDPPDPETGGDESSPKVASPDSVNTTSARPRAPPPKSRREELLTISTSLDSLGWTKVFCDVRAGVPLPALSPPAAFRRPRREKLRSFIDERGRRRGSGGRDGGGVDVRVDGGEGVDVTLESREVLRLVRRGDAVLHVPMGHAVMVARTKTAVGARLHSRGRPVMDGLASELLDELSRSGGRPLPSTGRGVAVGRTSAVTAADTGQCNQQAQQGSSRRQKKSAINFWDEYYAKEEEEWGGGSSSKQWIIENTGPLLDLISSHVVQPMCITTTTRGPTIQILEIGCGTSALSRSLLGHLLAIRQRSPSLSNVGIKVVATDVSETCIRLNRQRDENFISSLGGKDELRYDILDILKQGSTSMDITASTSFSTSAANCMYDVIIDKGTIDTFLFRNARGNKGTERHPPLLVSLLCNIHNMLRNGGKYIIISPRRRIPSVRQFVGFASVERIKMDVALGALDGKMQQGGEDNDSSTITTYMYICVKADGDNQLDYSASSDSLFRDMHDIALVTDESKCSGCDLTFFQFRSGESITGRGEVFWKRKWSGHQIHCYKNSGNPGLK